VLAKMKRGYTVEQYREMMGRIREIVPECAVSSDFIVGHPGETQASFEKSLDLIRECRFKNSFIFKYSPRPGTKAYELFADEIPEEEKRRRNNVMLALQNEISEEDNCEFLGRRVDVLVEGPSKAAAKAESGEPRAESQASEQHADNSQLIQLVGRTRCDRIVVFEGNRRLAGTLAQVEVYDGTPTTLIGTIVTREYQHDTASLLPILS
jgi:tRNA-2-methylthio-N6-dimethylallyladenosine synthase